MHIKFLHFYALQNLRNQQSILSSNCLPIHYKKQKFSFKNDEAVGMKKTQKQEIIQNGSGILYPFLHSTQYYSHIITDHGLWNVGMGIKLQLFFHSRLNSLCSANTPLVYELFALLHLARRAPIPYVQDAILNLRHPYIVIATAITDNLRKPRALVVLL